MTRPTIPQPVQTVRRSLRVPAALDAQIQREADASGVTVSHAMIVLLAWGVDSITEGVAALDELADGSPNE